VVLAFYGASRSAAWAFIPSRIYKIGVKGSERGAKFNGLAIKGSRVGEGGGGAAEKGEGRTERVKEERRLP